jgi:ribonuclease HI
MEAPPENFVKINCDGAFYANTRFGGWGFAIREWDGGVISTGYGKLEHVSEAFHAEIIACLQAVN